MKCIYCKNEFDELSDEHVIQNAIGGLLTSKNICCSSCNSTLISKNIDVPFTNIFAPFSSLLDLKKSHSASSKPTYKAIASYNGKDYEVICKERKIIECIELKKELKEKFDKSIFEKMEAKEIKFSLNNNDFKQGLRKIAVNYALESNIDVDEIVGIEVENINGKVNNVSFNQLVIPFIPITLLDNAIENYKEEQLYHSLILFNKKNKLWCYIELFSTFKFYVLLNDNYKGKNINESYCQLVEKQDRTFEPIHIRRPKDVLIVANQYGIEPTMDEEELNQRIKKAILLKSNKQDFYIRNQRLVDNVCLKALLDNLKDKKRFEDFSNEFQYYIKQDPNSDIEDPKYYIDSSRYRVTFPNGESYPEIIMKLLSKDKNIANVYTQNKFNNISEYITKPRKR